MLWNVPKHKSWLWSDLGRCGGSCDLMGVLVVVSQSRHSQYRRLTAEFLRFGLHLSIPHVGPGVSWGPSTPVCSFFQRRSCTRKVMMGHGVYDLQDIPTYRAAPGGVGLCSEVGRGSGIFLYCVVPGSATWGGEHLPRTGTGEIIDGCWRLSRYEGFFGLGGLRSW